MTAQSLDNTINLNIGSAVVTVGVFFLPSLKWLVFHIFVCFQLNEIIWLYTYDCRNVHIDKDYGTKTFGEDGIDNWRDVKFVIHNCLLKISWGQQKG